jgi:hypothetical protein
VVAGQPATFVVTVTAASGTHTGTVAIADLRGVILVLPLCDSVATFQAILPHGRYTLRASYSGDATYLPSASDAQTVVAGSLAVQPGSTPGGGSVLLVGALPGQGSITLRKQVRWIAIRVNQTRGGRLHLSRRVAAGSLDHVVVYNDPARYKVLLGRGLTLPVVYHAPGPSARPRG